MLCVWCGDCVNGGDFIRLGGSPIHLDCCDEMNAEMDDAFPLGPEDFWSDDEKDEAEYFGHLESFC